MNIDAEVLNLDEVALLLGVGRTTLWRRMKDGSAPPYFRLGRRVLFPRDQLKNWLEAKSNQVDPFAGGGDVEGAAIRAS